MKDKKYYIVTAYRWGERSDHSYFVGLFDKKHIAIEAAKEEEDWRGGKYKCKVIETSVLKGWIDKDESELKCPYGSKI